MVVAAGSVLAAMACGSDGTAERRASGDAGPAVQYTPAQLDSAARTVVAFLRGQSGFEQLRLADSVALYVAPDGGGDRVVLRREQLRDRAAWEVSANGYPYGFRPPRDASRITTSVGRHFNCMEYPLASRFPDLAEYPHVGVRLQPPDTQSCLQVWNVTLVFDRRGEQPTLIAAVHDRWEW
jgi:hypothetical protein